MQINSISNTGLNVPSAVESAVARAPQAEKDPSADQKDLVRGNFLSNALDQTPDVRADAVSRGKELLQGGLQDAPYPPTAIIQGISRLVARNWNNA